jgi:hypothetical protein
MNIELSRFYHSGSSIGVDLQPESTELLFGERASIGAD